MANSKAVNELQSYINRGRKEEREAIAKSFLAEAKELKELAKKAGMQGKYEAAASDLRQAKVLTDMAWSIREMPKTW